MVHESRYWAAALLLSVLTLLISACAQVPAVSPSSSKLSYPIVDTDQAQYYDNLKEISVPKQGEPFYSQDAQNQGNQPGYFGSSDGLTVYDSVTGLTWQKSPDTNGDGSLTRSDKLNWAQAQARPTALNATSYGGFNDWRLPSIKELYSLIKFNGTDPSNLTSNDTSGLTPFIDTNYFKFAYGQTNVGERIIDSQYASSTLDVSKGWNGDKLFGVNFADGRIKGYGLAMLGTGGQPPGGNKPPVGIKPNNVEKTFFVQCVRGNLVYGQNNFADNSDGTITDRATGLMWSQPDSGSGMNWKDALSWVQARNAVKFLGFNDWRLPNAKELQSIVDYTRSPDSTGTAAINPLFTCTRITNEAGQTDYPFYWTGTTHASSGGAAGAGVYVAFGRAMGYMNGLWQDVHGAGAQRSDPKSGDPANFPTGRGPQGDAIRINNFVRLVRDAEVECQ